MRIHFTVFGDHEADLTRLAHEVIDTFSTLGSRWTINIDARAVQTNTGSILSWEADVDATRADATDSA